jgi:DNA (cytosine-5)-methyltransferase 1
MIWYESDNPNGFVTGKKFSIDKPCVTIMAAGMGGDSYGHWHIMTDGQESLKLDKDKPPYQVPTMPEISAIPWNGLKVASTFSGCGGSCLGYRMAGFRVVWANEFISAAQDSYNANKSPECYLDKRDIKTVEAEEILKQTGLKKGELDLFDGSPPCQAFSTAGKRHKGWGKDRQYENGVAQKNEQLFDEYIRLVDGLQPRVFVAENVSGLVKGTAKGMFLEILAALKGCGYRVKCKVLDAQWLGVPQTRRRVIFIGVREDLNCEPVHPSPLSYRYSVRDALPWIQKARNDPRGQFPIQEAAGTPCFTITISNRNHIEVEEVPPLPPSVAKGNRLMQRTADPDKPSPTITCASPGNDTLLAVEPEAKIITDPASDAKGRLVGKEWSVADPLGTVTAAGLDGGNKPKVVDSTGKRKFSIAELRRICAFPDDFILTGSYAQQWERLGNSVPPVMMFHIAKTIRDEMLLDG